LAASKPGVRSRERDYEMEAAKAEIVRLSEACKELAKGTPHPQPSP
jgi:hypothetical protein